MNGDVGHDGHGSCGTAPGLAGSTGLAGFLLALPGGRPERRRARRPAHRPAAPAKQSAPQAAFVTGILLLSCALRLIRR
jgi:hypothetical protein